MDAVSPVMEITEDQLMLAPSSLPGLCVASPETQLGGSKVTGWSHTCQGPRGSTHSPPQGSPFRL